MKKTFLFFSFFLFIFLENSFAQAPTIQWQKCLGGASGDDYAFSIKQTLDGGYIVAGYTDSNDGDVIGHHGSHDSWIVKLDGSGAIQWQKCLGGFLDDVANSIQQTTDLGYIVAGYTYSYDGDVSGNHGNEDCWIVKLDSSGTIQWQKCIGGLGYDATQSIQQTTDGGYIIAGYTDSNDSNVSGNHGGRDYWIAKIDSSGVIQWQKCLGGSGDDEAFCIRQNIDGGYIVAGESGSNNGEVSGNHGGFDYWITKIDSNGTLQWQECLGGSYLDEALSIQQTSDSGYVVAGRSASTNGDVIKCNHGGFDYWIIKFSSVGVIQWKKCLGGTDDDIAYSIQQTSDRGYVVAGYSSSNDGDVSGKHLGGYLEYDYWIVKLDSSGNIKWQKCLGGSNDDYAQSIEQTKDGGYIVAGYTYSNDGDVSGNHSNNYDYWIVKLSPEVGINELSANENSVVLYSNPAAATLTVQLAENIKGKVSFGIYDVMGREASPPAPLQRRGEIGSYDIDVSALSAGVYFLQVKTESGVVAKKFVKE